MNLDLDNLLSHLDNARGTIQEAESMFNGPADDENAIEVTLMSIAYSLLHIAENFPTTARDADDSQLSVMGNADEGTAMLQCEREERRVPGNCSSGLCWWTEDLPYHANLEQVRQAYMRHLATHSPA